MTLLETVTSEILCKRKCYTVCAVYDAADFDAALAGVCEEAALRGANTLYFAMRDESCPLTEAAYTLGGRAFVFDTEFTLLEKDLSDARDGRTPLRTKRANAGDDALFCAIYNEAFFHVSNSVTMDDAEIRAIEADARRDAGFFMEGGEPVGVYALDYREEPPEIAAIGIRADFRGEGYGTRALHTLEMRLLQEGHVRAQLLVAEDNAPALALYAASGYRQLRRLSRWYRTQL